jgi:hypothetical protein
MKPDFNLIVSVLIALVLFKLLDNLVLSKTIKQSFETLPSYEDESFEVE